MGGEGRGMGRRDEGGRGVSVGIRSCEFGNLKSPNE